MQIKARNYPHPVQSPWADDITNGTFETNLQVKTSRTHFSLDVDANTDNVELNKLIQEGKAHYGVHVECPSTRYRHAFVSSESKSDHLIAGGDVNGNVEVSILILASEHLQYKNPDFHPDYGERVFSVQRGDTLAVAGTYEFNADREADQLSVVPSIFLIVPADRDNAPPMDVDLSRDKIIVTLARKNYEAFRYLKANPNMASVLNSMIVAPALICALEEMKNLARLPEEESSDSQHLRWYIVIANRLRAFGYDPLNFESLENAGSTIQLCQKIIGSPVEQGLKNLHAYEGHDDVEEED